jgi:hypothetical protein
VNSTCDSSGVTALASLPRATRSARLSCSAARIRAEPLPDPRALAPPAAASAAFTGIITTSSAHAVSVMPGQDHALGPDLLFDQLDQHVEIRLRHACRWQAAMITPNESPVPSPHINRRCPYRAVRRWQAASQTLEGSMNGASLMWVRHRSLPCRSLSHTTLPPGGVAHIVPMG